VDKTTFKRSFKLSVALLAVLSLAAGTAAAWEWWQAQRQPSREPDFRGRIIAEGGAGFLLESPQGGQCWFRPPVGTRIRTRSGEPGSLAVGQKVKVWSTGPVRLTYPPQADAHWIVIEEDKPQAQPQ